MKHETCSKCGQGAMVIRGNHRFDDMGLSVVLENVELVKCEACGTVEPIIPNMDGLMHAMAIALISHPSSLEGDEIRFLRKYLGLGTEEFSALLHIDKATLSRWENGQDIGAQSDRLIRLLVLNKSEGLREYTEKMMNIFPQLTNKRPQHRAQLKIDPKTLEYEFA